MMHVFIFTGAVTSVAAVVEQVAFFATRSDVGSTVHDENLQLSKYVYMYTIATIQ